MARRERSGGIAAPPHEIAAPGLAAGVLACPRCRTRLFTEGDELICVMCGYEYEGIDLVAVVREHASRYQRKAEASCE